MMIREAEEVRIRMWSLSVVAERALPVIPPNKKPENEDQVFNKDTKIFYPSAEPVYPSAAKLSVHTENVYDEAINFGKDVRVIRNKI